MKKTLAITVTESHIVKLVQDGDVYSVETHEAVFGFETSETLCPLMSERYEDDDLSSARQYYVSVISSLLGGYLGSAQGEIDLRFESKHPTWDEALVDAVRAAKSRGCTVTIPDGFVAGWMAQSWRHLRDDYENLKRRVRRHNERVGVE